jgi:hypothetical protein
MLKITVLTLVLISSNLVSGIPNPKKTKPATTSNLTPDYDIFDVLFGWLLDYDEDDDLDFNNKNVTSK